MASNTKFSGLIATQFKESYFGNNWTCSSLKEHLADVTWVEAITPVNSLNTIATLVFHLNYYVANVVSILQGTPVVSKDKEAFDHPPIRNQKDWHQFLQKIWSDGQLFSELIAKVPDDMLDQVFIEDKYRHYYRNFHGITEHVYYHLGQIVLLKKIIRGQ